MNALPSNSKALLDRIESESEKFLATLSPKERYALKDWQDNAHDLVNRRLQGLSFYDMRLSDLQGKGDSHISEFDVFIDEYFYWPFRSASFNFWSQTSFWKRLSKDQQDIFTAWLNDIFKKFTKRTNEDGSYLEANLPRFERLFGEAFVKTQYKVYEARFDEEKQIHWPKEFYTKGPESFFMHYYKSIVGFELQGHFGPFTYAQMDEILDTAVSEYTNLFSRGFTLDEKVYLYRGLKTRFTKRNFQFQATTLRKHSLDLFCFHSEACGSVILYVLPPGTPFFMLDRLENEVVLSWNRDFVQLADPEPLALFTDKEHIETVYPGHPRQIFMTYKYMVFPGESLSGGWKYRSNRSKKRYKKRSKKSFKKRSKIRSKRK